jgi:CRP/FNR family transcriptional regulator
MVQAPVLSGRRTLGPLFTPWLDKLVCRVINTGNRAMDLTYLLRSCHLFSDLNESELQALQPLALRKDYRKGQIVFTEGDPSRGFFLVASGTVKIFRVGPDGRERVFHVVETGESFAEAAMFMDAYPATAEALAPSTIVSVEKNGFKQLLLRDPHLSFKIIGTLVRSLSQMRNALTDLMLKEVPARFASYVLSLPVAPGNPIKMTISKTTIAQMLGTTKETFSRLLARLAHHHILTYRGNQIRILSRARLQAIARGDVKI